MTLNLKPISTFFLTFQLIFFSSDIPTTVSQRPERQRHLVLQPVRRLGGSAGFDELQSLGHRHRHQGAEGRKLGSLRCHQKVFSGLCLITFLNLHFLTSVYYIDLYLGLS
jgi:hypothetical protein